MDIDDEAFADNFDEDLLRAVEQQESQYFGAAAHQAPHGVDLTASPERGECTHAPCPFI
jgi:hypothetical protein